MTEDARQYVVLPAPGNGCVDSTFNAQSAVERFRKYDSYESVNSGLNHKLVSLIGEGKPVARRCTAKLRGPRFSDGLLANGTGTRARRQAIFAADWLRELKRKSPAEQRREARDPRGRELHDTCVRLLSGYAPEHSGLVTAAPKR